MLPSPSVYQFSGWPAGWDHVGSFLKKCLSLGFQPRKSDFMDLGGAWVWAVLRAPQVILQHLRTTHRAQPGDSPGDLVKTQTSGLGFPPGFWFSGLLGREEWSQEVAFHPVSITCYELWSLWSSTAVVPHLSFSPAYSAGEDHWGQVNCPTWSPEAWKGQSRSCWGSHQKC